MSSYRDLAMAGRQMPTLAEVIMRVKEARARKAQMAQMQDRGAAPTPAGAPAGVSIQGQAPTRAPPAAGQVALADLVQNSPMVQAVDQATMPTRAVPPPGTTTYGTPGAPRPGEMQIDSGATPPARAGEVLTPEEIAILGAGSTITRNGRLRGMEARPPIDRPQGLTTPQAGGGPMDPRAAQIRALMSQGLTFEQAMRQVQGGSGG